VTLEAAAANDVLPDGTALQVRLAGGASPEGRCFELTCREQVFAPVQRGLNYIGVSGSRIFHAANAVPIPLPQRGALSATAGHHWIIEDCEIGHVDPRRTEVLALAVVFAYARPLRRGPLATGPRGQPGKAFEHSRKVLGRDGPQVQGNA
jgi:hypothetical protein